jgi:hypothetical protein
VRWAGKFSGEIQLGGYATHEITILPRRSENNRGGFLLLRGGGRRVLVAHRGELQLYRSGPRPLWLQRVFGSGFGANDLEHFENRANAAFDVMADRLFIHRLPEAALATAANVRL